MADHPPVRLSEDDLFRASTQYRMWSYSPEALAKVRESTNALAASRVRDAIQRQCEERDDPVPEVDCLSPEEERRLVSLYCVHAMDFADLLEMPTNVKATAVQYLKRFYLHNSPMTYHPKEFMPTALFLATKTDNHYTPLSKVASKLPNTTAEAIKAPEFTLVQGLRFSFDVRHPQRGLEGGFMELQAMLEGRYVPHPASPLSPVSIAEQMLTIPPAEGARAYEPSAAGVQKRLQVAHTRTSSLLKTGALLSDAYFLYTPAQIWLAAFLAADAPLGRFYLSTVLSSAAVPVSDPDGSAAQPLDSVLTALKGCRALLGSRAAARPDEEEMRELRLLNKKLSRCSNPAKADLAGLKGPVAEKKRDSEEGTGEEEEHKAKKRRVADDDVFGGSLH